MPASMSRLRWRPSASSLMLLSLISLLAWFSSTASASPTAPTLKSRSQTPFLSQASPESYDAFAAQRVNVTLAVMSRCPDALACEAAFDKVLDRVKAKTRLTMSYIGSLDHDKHSKYGASCMHGDQECAGNVQQLCVQDALNPVRAGQDFDLSPSAAQKMWWNFLQCQNFAGISKIGQEDLAQRCLRVVDGPSWDKDGIAKCVHGNQGRHLLRHSIKASKQRDLVTSCTIVFENGKKCIRDGGAWKNCDLGHEPADFIAEIERIWSKKNAGLKTTLDSSSTKTLPQAATRLVKRQSSPSSTDNSGFNNPFAGSSTPPSVFRRLQLQRFFRDIPRLAKRQSTGGFQFQGPNLPIPFLAFAITAIALFVIVVCFVLLRIIMRNRRLRRLGLLPEGPFDRLLGPTREIEDTLPPPKLLEARIAHDFRPAAYDAEVKAKGWDAVMPISAAVPPVLYSDLFPKGKGQDNSASNGVTDGENADATTQNGFSYPPTSGSTSGLTRRLHVPAFLRRQGDGSHHDDAAANTHNGIGSETGDKATNGESKGIKADTSTPASVNVTVLIAMPSQRTVFPTTGTLKSQRSLNMDGLTTFKIDEAEESADGSRSLRRTASIKSFRTAASSKSIGDARREAFFNKMNDEEGNTAANDIHTTHIDDEDEEELPELVFGTASVPIFTRITGPDAAGRDPFAGTIEAYQPLRSELIRLVTTAHEARERKAAMEAAAKQAEKDAANADDGQTTIDERSTNQGQTATNANNGGTAADDRRVSASETIDSETAAIIGSVGVSTVPVSHQEGLGNVVSRMMMPEPTQHGTSTSSPVPATAIGVHRFSEDPRPSIGVNSNLSRDDTSTPVPGDAHAAPYNTSTLTLDPLLGDSAGSYTGSNLRNTSVPERSA
ncbi:probable conserved hypothetcial protein [Ustilago trichophora]|uniref:Probable conserved hypothetcial protein n=1 Tax=Ustilago trichophora TaxID=86804 RepID=A0A5C3EQ90_9BASI|nr:probable conserved hypothetcial protein [Ustilago trichophora]